MVVYTKPVTIPQIIATIASTLAGLVSFHFLFTRLIWTPVKNSLITDMKKELDCRLDPILKLVSQLETNGGSHLADRLIRVEERQAGVMTRLDDLFELVKSMKG
jgi:hypothetical protein